MFRISEMLRYPDTCEAKVSKMQDRIHSHVHGYVRRIDDDTQIIDSVCTACYRTVATSKDIALIEMEERSHRCGRKAQLSSVATDKSNGPQSHGTIKRQNRN